MRPLQPSAPVFALTSRAVTPDQRENAASSVRRASLPDDDDAVLVGEDRSLDPVAQAGLGKDVAIVALDCRLSHDEVPGKLSPCVFGT
jgi:hypothetical protein